MAAAAAPMPKHSVDTWSSIKNKNKNKIPKGKEERKTVTTMFHYHDLVATSSELNNKYTPFKNMNKYMNERCAVQTSNKWRRHHKKQAEAKAEAKAETARQEEMKKHDEARKISETLITEIAKLELTGMEID